MNEPPEETNLDSIFMHAHGSHGRGRVEVAAEIVAGFLMIGSLVVCICVGWLTAPVYGFMLAGCIMILMALFLE